MLPQTKIVNSHRKSQKSQIKISIVVKQKYRFERRVFSWELTNIIKSVRLSLPCCWFAADVTAAMLTKDKSAFSPLGIKTHFHENNFITLTTSMAALSRDCK